MNEPKHTPGPYKVQQWSDCYTIYTDHPDYSGRSIADTVGDMPQDEINAQLLAAAPDLLDTCQRVLDAIEHNLTHDTLPETRAALRAAITKATGEPQK